MERARGVTRIEAPRPPEREGSTLPERDVRHPCGLEPRRSEISDDTLRCGVISLPYGGLDPADAPHHGGAQRRVALPTKCDGYVRRRLRLRPARCRRGASNRLLAAARRLSRRSSRCTRAGARRTTRRLCAGIRPTLVARTERTSQGRAGSGRDRIGATEGEGSADREYPEGEDEEAEEHDPERQQRRCRKARPTQPAGQNAVTQCG